MRTKLAVVGLCVCFCGFFVLSAMAGPSLLITKPPVTPLEAPTGPGADATSTQGQWFRDLASGTESFRPFEFYDNSLGSGGGFAGSGAITGYVNNITYLGLPGSSPIVAFTIQATIWNDTAMPSGSLPAPDNAHGETMDPAEMEPYVGSLFNTKLTASFALTDINNVPAGWTGPYTYISPFIVATNEDQAAWYCWSPEGSQQPTGGYFVPTWNFGNIPFGQSVTRQLDFSIPLPGLPTSDARYSQLVQSFTSQSDILLNRSTSLKVSSWQDRPVQDTGVPYPINPLYGSDVSVFHDALDFGDAPDPSYPTLLANNGARHAIVSGAPCLGDPNYLPDADADGQPDPAALGDDRDITEPSPNDDEDGVTIPTLTRGQQGTVTVEVDGPPGWVDAWIDWNGNGTWEEPAERILGEPMSNGPYELPVTPPGPFFGTTFARFRIHSAQGNLPPTGPADDGEVEDHAVEIQAGPPDFGDAPEGALAYPGTTTTGQFPTCTGMGPAGWIQHGWGGAHFGSGPGPAWDGEPDGNADQCPPSNANWYDKDECFADDDAGLLFPAAYTITGPQGEETVGLCSGIPAVPSLGVVCQTAIWGQDIDIQVVNDMPVQGYVNVLMDWNRNGIWAGSSVCPPAGDPAPEHVLVDFPVPAGFNGPLSALQPPPFLIGPNPSYVWCRFSITEMPVPSGEWDGSGTFAQGETEDYLLQILAEPAPELDFGDADEAEGDYPTTLLRDGARHVIVSGAPWLGDATDMPDAEPDGQPDGNALGDDNDWLYPPANDDEDGVTIPVLTVGHQGTVTVLVNGPPGGGWVDAWIDWDRDGTWQEPAERVYGGSMPLGPNPIPVTPPGRVGITFARFRIHSAQGNLPPTGPADDGEVEDHSLRIERGMFDFGDAPYGVLAYPATGVPGGFPTCFGMEFGWIQHALGGAHFGPGSGPEWDSESDGNAGFCDNLGTYNQDECFNDGDAGLLFPDAYTITGPQEEETVVPCSDPPAVPALGTVCQTAIWGQNIDIHVVNSMPVPGYVNVLMDWDHNGGWAGSSVCPPAGPPAPEYVLVDFPVPAGFNGSLSALQPPPFLIGPNPGYVWCRFSITERPVEISDWDGSGEFEEGETEDYLLQVQGLDFGDAPDPTYPTLLANNGARHWFDSGLYLGALIDAESDGQPDATATGDDLANLADEDGVAFVGTLLPGQAAQVTVTASGPGMLDAWIDFGNDGSWTNAGDQIFASYPLVAGANTINFTVPPATVAGITTYGRFRFSTAGGLGITGAAADGEVEDYQIEIAQWPKPAADLGDAPDSSNTWGLPMTAYGWGGLPPVVANYPTVYQAGSPPFGPIHNNPGATVFLGGMVSVENEADISADADGVNNILPNLNVPDQDGQDDGLVFPVTLPHCQPTVLNYLVSAVVPPPGMLFVNVWFDWNRDGDWNDSMNCPNGNSAPEWAVQNQILPPPPLGMTPQMTPPFNCWHPASTAQPIWMRVTLSDLPCPGPMGYNGAAGDGPPGGFQLGETEDYYLTDYQTDEALDLGDAPDPAYPTLLASDGARHSVVPGFCLGLQIDAEADGWQSPNADGDDMNPPGLDDEDGVVFTNQLLIGRQGCMDIFLSGPAGGRLDGWVDFNIDGFWGPGEQVLTSLALSPGINTGICFNVPGNTPLGPTFARFRLSSAGGLAPVGAAQDGEVEDYRVTIRQPGNASGKLAITNILCLPATTVTVWWADADVGLHYQLQSTANLTNGAGQDWSNVGPHVIGPVNWQTDTNLLPLRFYRVTMPWTP